MKVCIRCKSAYPENHYSIVRVHRPNGGTRTSTICRLCLEAAYQRQLKRTRERYATDPEFKARRKAQAKPAQHRRKYRYRDDPEYRRHVLAINARHMAKKRVEGADSLKEKARRAKSKKFSIVWSKFKEKPDS